MNLAKAIENICTVLTGWLIIKAQTVGNLKMDGWMDEYVGVS